MTASPPAARWKHHIQLSSELSIDVISVRSLTSQFLRHQQVNRLQITDFPSGEMATLSEAQRTGNGWNWLRRQVDPDEVKQAGNETLLIFIN